MLKDFIIFELKPTFMLYFIASRYQQGEYLVLANTAPLGPVCCPTLRDAKGQFEQFYQRLPTEPEGSFRYTTLFEVLAIIHPVIITLDVDEKTALAKIYRMLVKPVYFKPQVPVLLIPHVLTPLKPGTIKKYEQLDIYSELAGIRGYQPQLLNEIIQDYEFQAVFKDIRPSVN